MLFLMQSQKDKANHKTGVFNKIREIQQENAGLRLPDRFGNAVQQIGISCQDKKKIG
jgi:hypothetical protein